MVSEKFADKPQILVVDDDSRIRQLVSRFLNETGFLVVTAEDAAQAKDTLGIMQFDAMVLDIMMPGQSGLEFTKAMREEGHDIPVILLTALGETEDKIDGFESGADDYLPKPFEPRELVLRLQAILRRRQRPQAAQQPVHIGPWLYDPSFNELRSDDEVQRLTDVQGKLLRALASEAGVPLSRERLAELCELDAGGERTIDVQITRLRRKIEEDTKAPRYIQTVRGKGYLLRTND